MRCKSIKVHMEIPIRVNSKGTSPHFECDCFKDCNGTVYELQAIKDACEEADKSGVPIIQYSDSGDPIVIGIANAVKYNPEGYIEVDGMIGFGGTIEKTVFSSTKDVVAMDIQSIGFTT